MLPESALRPAPAGVRALAHVIRWLPSGRYRLIHESRRLAIAPFVAHLSRDLGGLAFVCDPRDSVAREVCYTGIYEPQETRLAARIVRRGDVFVDVGANWGYFTLAASHWTGAGGRVLAFEPEPRLFELLRGNLALNGLRAVEAYPVAIAERHGLLPFSAFVADDGNWGVSHPVSSDASADFQVEAAALDDMLDAAAIDQVQLTKIDVEGGEPAVLAGMRRGLQAGRYRYLLLECHPVLLARRGVDEAEALRPLVEGGYTLWAIVHTPSMHRLAARTPVASSRLLRPYEHGSFRMEWPHLLAVAPDAPAVC